MMMVSRDVLAMHKIDLILLVLHVAYQEVWKRMWTWMMLSDLWKSIDGMTLSKWLYIQHGVVIGCRATRHWI